MTHANRRMKAGTTSLRPRTGGKDNHGCCYAWQSAGMLITWGQERLTGSGRDPMSGCTAAARCCVLRPGLDVSSASKPLTLASWRAFTSLFITSAFCGHCHHRQEAMVQPTLALREDYNMTAIASRLMQTS